MSSIEELIRENEKFKGRFGIDAFGGDVVNGLSVCHRVAKAVRNVAPLYVNCHFSLAGDADEIKHHLGRRHPSNITVVDKSSKVSSNGETRYDAIRFLAKQLKSGELDGVYTAGNTKAVTPVISHYIGIMDEYSRHFSERLLPLLAEVPKSPTVERAKSYFLIDAGSIPQLTRPEQFLIYAKLGIIYAAAVGERSQPRVALGNIGREKEKGTKLLKETYELFNSEIHGSFIGNCEPYGSTHEHEKGDKEHKIEADVIVTSGEMGNVLIKALAAGAHLASDFIKDEIKKGNWLEQLCGLYLNRKHGAFQRAKSQMEPTRYGGAAYVCANLPVFKNHGVASQEGFEVGFQKLIRYVDKKAVDRIRWSLAA